MIFTGPIGATGEKFLELGTFSCIFNAIFRFLSPIQVERGFFFNLPTCTSISVGLSGTKVIKGRRGGGGSRGEVGPKIATRSLFLAKSFKKSTFLVCRVVEPRIETKVRSFRKI